VLDVRWRPACSNPLAYNATVVDKLDERPPGRTRHKGEVNVKTYFKEMCCKCV
jgi:hypothetical protein